MAEKVLGAETIKKFAHEQVEHFASLARQGYESAASEKTRWEFFRDVSSSISFDLLSETISLVQDFRPQLLEKGLGVEEGIDFRKAQWWL